MEVKFYGTFQNLPTSSGPDLSVVLPGFQAEGVAHLGSVHSNRTKRSKKAAVRTIMKIQELVPERTGLFPCSLFYQ